mmetsp:Transcript_102306/g.328038  ORF Transcript_102306/g.328038 Transcript_102306/m.328038 type:complete len:214 (+) Transcript_102306:510-1151(+)
MSADWSSSGKMLPGAPRLSLKRNLNKPYSVALSSSKSTAGALSTGCRAATAAAKALAAASLRSSRVAPEAMAAVTAACAAAWSSGVHARFLAVFFSFFVALIPPARARCVAPPPSPRSEPSIEMKYSVPSEERYSRILKRRPSAVSGQSRTSRQRMQRQLLPMDTSSEKMACLKFVLLLPATMEHSGMSRITRLSRIQGCTSAFTRANRSINS